VVDEEKEMESGGKLVEPSYRRHPSKEWKSPAGRRIRRQKEDLKSTKKANEQRRRKERLSGQSNFKDESEGKGSAYIGEPA